MIASSKIDDKLLQNNKVDERLFGKNGIVDGEDNFENTIGLHQNQKSSTIKERIEKGEISTQIQKGKQRKQPGGNH